MKISVIVPVYNVDKYIKRAVDSIINQTYSNIEIILVDDGSTDDSKHICDAYAESENRVRVIHQVNGGAACARNTGIEASNGSYIMFVDADDEVTHNSIEVLLKTALSTGAEIVTGVVERLHTDYCDKKMILVNDFGESMKILDNKQGIESYLSGGTAVYAMARLYKKNILEKVRFAPDIRLGEDLLFVYEAVKSAQLSVYIDCIVYYYYKIKSSQTNSDFSDKFLDVEIVSDIIFENAKKSYPEFINLAQTNRFLSLVWLYNNMTLSVIARHEYFNEYTNLRKRIVSNNNIHLSNKFDRFKYRVLKFSALSYIILAYIYNFTIVKIIK